jgi:indolepyruvate ferredoxin oxidoreductase beta subunit
LAGVGGQGTLLASEIIGSASLKQGLNVRASEIHGMAQRGGSVVSNVRIGSNVYSSIVRDGSADVLLGFEPLETLRSLKSASNKTLVIMSSDRIPPTELAAKAIAYPDMQDIQAKLRLFTNKIVIVEAVELARKAGSRLAQNSVLLGCLAEVKDFPVKAENLIASLKELVPEKHVDVNIKAFDLGCQAMKQKLATV